MAYTVPPAAICAASMATEPLPAPTSHTMLVGPRSISASAIDRTSAGVSRPCLGFDCRNTSSGLPNSRRPIASLGRSGTFGLRTRIITFSGSGSWTHRWSGRGNTRPACSPRAAYADSTLVSLDDRGAALNASATRWAISKSTR